MKKHWIKSLISLGFVFAASITMAAPLNINSCGFCASAESWTPANNGYVCDGGGGTIAAPLPGGTCFSYQNSGTGYQLFGVSGALDDGSQTNFPLSASACASAFWQRTMQVCVYLNPQTWVANQGGWTGYRAPGKVKCVLGAPGVYQPYMQVNGVRHNCPNMNRGTTGNSAKLCGECYYQLGYQ